SAYPVALTEFEGSRLYTNWSNLRSPVNSLSSYNPVLSHRGITASVVDKYFTIGISGYPLWLLDMEDIRGGIVFQNFGGKSANYNFDFDSQGILDSEYTRLYVDELITSSTIQTTMRKKTEETDVKYWTNTSYNQWNIGLAKKTLVLDNLSVGLSLANRNSKNVLKSGGTKKYTDVYLNDFGAQNAGMPSGSTKGDNFTIKYAENEVDQNSWDQTDILAQGRYQLMDNLVLDAGLGLKFAVNVNPGGLIDPINFTKQNPLRKDVIEVTGEEAVNTLTLGDPNPKQYFHTGKAIRNESLLPYLLNPTLINIGSISGNTGIWSITNNPGTTDFDDKRSGVGPKVRLQGTYKTDKVDLTGVLNYATIEQKIDAKQTLRDYLYTEVWVSSYQKINTTFIDYTAKNKWDGKSQQTNLDLGLKVEFKTLEKMKLALGGFILTQTHIDEFSKLETDYTSKTSTSAVNIPGGLEITKTGKYSGSGKNETITTIYSVPLGMELAVGKKWTLRFGTEYVMTKTQNTSIAKRQRSIETTVRVDTDPNNAKTTSTTYSENLDPIETKTVSYTESHNVSFSYGVQFDVNKNLSIACNAFLDTNQNKGVDTNGDGIIDTYQKASIFDLDTYRLLAIQAIFKF
ncbi:MAG: hypothetical protein NZ839_03455, partial [Endomicrobia bacterium]|nr:hypothetical protein [Endomicrobiia bacterium]